MLLQNKKLNLIENSINDRLDDFYNFRINHYNSKIEKFLMDFEFEQKQHRYGNNIKLKYKPVTKSQAKNNGGIDGDIEVVTDKENSEIYRSISKAKDGTSYLLLTDQEASKHYELQLYDKDFR